MLRRLAATSTDNQPVYYEITDIKKEDHETKMGTCKTNDKIKNNNSNTENNECRHTDLELAGYNKYFYHFLGKRYCNTDKGMGDDWCSCYNIMANKCEGKPDIPGCSDTKDVWSDINSHLSEKDKAQFEGMRQCIGNACVGFKYRPENYNKNCDRNVLICNADLNVGGNIIGSNVSINQDCSVKSDQVPEPVVTRSSELAKGTLVEKIFKFEEDKEKSLIQKTYFRYISTLSCMICMGIGGFVVVSIA
tara:strand:+ start:44 stop:787 length:744 start_codon:yes stop_codon:yes gene_type:complete